MSFDHFMQSPVLLAIAGALVGGLRAGVMSWRKNGKARAVSDGSRATGPPGGRLPDRRVARVCAQA